MLREDARKGMKVFFGRGRGEKTLAEIEKCNDKSCKVKTLEQRGNGRGSEIGSFWNVDYSLLTPADTSAAAVRIPAPQPLEYNPFSSVDNLILQAIMIIHNTLSPENLSCDGEASMAHINATRRECNRQLKGLQMALGREVTEEQTWAWYQSKEAYEAKRKA